MSDKKQPKLNKKAIAMLAALGITTFCAVNADAMSDNTSKQAEIVRQKEIHVLKYGVPKDSSKRDFSVKKYAAPEILRPKPQKEEMKAMYAVPQDIIMNEKYAPPQIMNRKRPMMTKYAPPEMFNREVVEVDKYAPPDITEPTDDESDFRPSLPPREGSPMLKYAPPSQK